MRRRALAVVLTALALAGTAAVPAGACPRASLPDIEDEVMCPVCGTPLNVAQAPQADRERAFIRQRISACDTKAQIKRALVGQFGPEILATPQGRGFDLAAWLVPIAVVVAALAGLAIALPRWRRRRPAGIAQDEEELSESDARRLDEDLARYDL